MRVLILAAGQGARLAPLTNDRPKCCVTVSGRRMIDWQLQALRQTGVSRIGIVRGYRSDQVAPKGCDLYSNDRYASTNMVASLMCAREFFPTDEPLLVAYSDIVYEPRLVRAVQASRASFGVVVDDDWKKLWERRFADPLEDAETLKVDAAGNLAEIGRRPGSLEDIDSQYVGLIRLEPGMARALAEIWDALDKPFRGRSRDGLYMTDLIQLAIDAGHPCQAIRVRGGWCEVDSPSDLPVAEDILKKFNWD